MFTKTYTCDTSCRCRSEVIDLVHQLLKTVLLQVLGPDIRQVVFRGNVVGGDLVFLDQLTDVEEPQSDMFGARTVCMVPNDVKCGRVVYFQRHSFELLIKP